MYRIGTPLFAATLLALSSSPAFAQLQCVAEAVSLIIGWKVVTLKTGKDICRQGTGVVIKDASGREIVAWVWSENYKRCIIQGVRDLNRTATANSTGTIDDITQALGAHYTQMTTDCVNTVSKKWLNFPLPEGVIVLPFPPEARKEGIILFSTVILWNTAQMVEWGNFPLGQNGAYYLENPFTKEVLLQGDTKLKRFVELFQTKVKQTVITNPTQAAQLVVDTAKEVQ